MFKFVTDTPVNWAERFPWLVLAAIVIGLALGAVTLACSYNVNNLHF